MQTKLCVGSNKMYKRPKIEDYIHDPMLIKEILDECEVIKNEND